MSNLEQDINNGYTDIYGLVSPYGPPQTNAYRASDNGVLFTSEYLLLQRIYNDPVDCDAMISIQRCVGSDKYLHRSPGDSELDAPDDHYGYLSVYSDYDPLQIKILLNVIMQPAIFYLWAHSRSGMLGYILKPITWLLMPLIALIIAFSNVFDNKTSTSNRMLTWCLIQGTKHHSLLLKLAGRFWMWRQKLVYQTSNPMQTISDIYFGQYHPITKYMVSE